MNERDIIGLLLARRDNYEIGDITPVAGKMYRIMVRGQEYQTVILLNSFEFYEKRYHLAQALPTLVICFEHNTVLPIPVLSLKNGNLAQPYELPGNVDITDLEATRRSKLAHKVLLGMYLNGMKAAQAIIKDLPETTRRRYISEARTLAKRKRGRPVRTLATQAS